MAKLNSTTIYGSANVLGSVVTIGNTFDVSSANGLNISNSNSISSVVITNVGNSYQGVPTVTFSNTTTGGVTANANAVMRFTFTPYLAGNVGFGYANGDYLYANVNGSLANAVFQVTSNTATTYGTGGISAISLINAGLFFSFPNYYNSAGVANTGTPAYIQITGNTSVAGSGANIALGSNGLIVNNVYFSNYGAGYVEPPTVTFSGGSPSTAATGYPTVGTGTNVKFLGGGIGTSATFSTPSGPALIFSDAGVSAPSALVIKNGANPQLLPALNNADLYLSSTGTGSVRFYTNSVSYTQLLVTPTISAVNFIAITGNTTTNGPIIYSAGSDSNIDINITPKGIGNVNINTGNTNFYGNTTTFGLTTTQNSNLKGSGQNFFPYSQAFGNGINGGWGTLNSLAIYFNSTTAPDGTTTATILNPITGTDEAIRNTIAYSLVAGAYYTTSVYAKKGTVNFLRLRNLFVSGGSSAGNAWFNLNTGTIGTVQSNQLATITNVGNGWYRCALTGLASATSSVNDVDISLAATDATNTSTSGDTLYVWGAQLEFGSVAGPYANTGSTIIYNTPSISFSNSASIGMQSDGSLFIQPIGTGALQAQQTTSSATGGNVRGSNAVDWQTSRTAATQVANGQYAVLGGGNSNTVSGTKSAVLGGDTNNASGAYSFIGGGTSNLNSGYGAVISGGRSNNVGSSDFGAILGGYGNSATGYFSIVGGGYTNTGTFNTAVTTQATATITSGSTAVTLSASNGSIKVGQLITGTPIASWTYVAAISGTSLTLSQNATSSTNATLSFYTPHGVVVGGGNNTANGSYSFVGGGGDAGASANGNKAIGDWSTVAGGWGNQASGIGAFVGGGGPSGSSGVIGGNLASGASSVVAGGYSNQATNLWSSVLGGGNNLAGGAQSAVVGGRYHSSSGTYSTMLGGTNAIARSVTGYVGVGIGHTVYNQGNIQAGVLVLSGQTTTSASANLTSDSLAASTTNQIIVPGSGTGSVSVITFYAQISARANTDAAGWKIEGVISRGSTGTGTTALVGTPTVTLLGATAGAIANTWGTVSSVAAVADTTNGALQIRVTGVASNTINWVATVRTNELQY